MYYYFSCKYASKAVKKIEEESLIYNTLFIDTGN